MKTFAAIENGAVVDVTVTSGFHPPPRNGVQYVACIPGVETGDTTADGVTFFRDGVQIVVPTPEEIPLWAFRSSLVLAGITEATVDAMLAELPQPARTVASIQWNYGNFIRRDHPLIDQLGGALGLTSEQINGVFRVAETLV
jgi:hypothetical protein